MLTSITSFSYSITTGNLLATINYTAQNHTKILSALNIYRSRIACSDLDRNEKSHSYELDPYSSDYFRPSENGITANLTFHDISKLPTSSNMNKLVYSENLSKLAAKEAEQCSFVVSSKIRQNSLTLNRSYRDFTMFDVGNPSWDPEKAVLIWFDDYRRKAREPFTIDEKTWVHTGQILALAKARKVGCAASRCSFESDYGPVKRFLFICLLDESKYVRRI